MRLRSFILASASALALTLGGALPAQAEPISAAIVTWATSAAFAASATGAFLISAGAVALNIGAAWAAAKLFGPKQGAGATAGATERQASIVSLTLGEVPRQAVFGRAGLGGSLADAVNWGGENGTDWEGLVIILADHRCQSLDGVWVGDTYVDLSAHGEGAVTGYNNQLEVYWRPGAPADPDFPEAYQALSSALAPGALAGMAKVFVAYKADAPDATSPTWSGRPSFVWVVKGKICYDPRLDSTVTGGSGAHRWATPSTWAWSENAEICRYNFQRGIYAQDQVADPEMLLVGRGLSALEAPGEAIFAAANLCDEDAEIDDVDGTEPRYRVGGVVFANQTFGQVEAMFAAAMGGVIVQRDGQVAVDPGAGKTPVASLTGADLVAGAPSQRSDFKPSNDRINTVLPRYPEPAQKWAETAGDVCRDLSDLTLDGGAREETLSLALVPFRTQAKRLAEIRRRQARMERTLAITLSPKWSGLEEGDWVTMTDDRLTAGAAIAFQVAAYGLDQGWRNTLALQQTATSVYGFGGEATAPGSSTPVPVPDALVLAGVTAVAIDLEGDSDTIIPAVRFAWTTPVDPAISRIRCEVRRYGQAVATPTMTEGVNAGTIDVTNGVAPEAAMEARLIPLGGPGRVVVPSDWISINTGYLVATNVTHIFDRTVADAMAQLDEALAAADAVTAAAAAVAAQAAATLEESRRMASALMEGLDAFHGQGKMVELLHYEGDSTSPIKATFREGLNVLDAADSRTLTWFSLLGAANGDTSAFELNLSTVKVSPSETLASRLSTLSAADGANSAAIVSEASARVSGDSANAASITALTSTVTANASTASAAVASEASTRASADSALSSSLSSLTSTVTSNNSTLTASIASEASTRASADSAITSSVTSLSSTVSGHTSSISTLSSTTATQSGNITTLFAKYGVAIDVDGHVSGFVLNSSGTSSSFVVKADKFAITKDGATADFGVSGGVVYANNLRVGYLFADTVETDNIVNNAVNEPQSYTGAAGLTLTTSEQLVMDFYQDVPDGYLELDVWVRLNAPASSQMVIVIYMAGAQIGQSVTQCQSSGSNSAYAPIGVATTADTGVHFEVKALATAGSSASAEADDYLVRYKAVKK